MKDLQSIPASENVKATIRQSIAEIVTDINNYNIVDVPSGIIDGWSAGLGASIFDHANLTAAKVVSISQYVSESKLTSILSSVTTDKAKIAILKWLGVDLAAWTGGRRVVVTNSGSLLENYQCLIELTSTNFDFGGAQTNGEDLRIKDKNGNLLDFWIESWSSSAQTAKVWVKVPSIPASGTTEVYLYYGNPSAASASNGTNTFMFFDDFSGDLSKWTVTQSAAGNVQIVNGELRMVGNSAWNTNAVVSVSTFTKPFILEFKHREDAALGWGCSGITTGGFPEHTGCKGVYGRFNDEGTYVVIRDITGVDYSGSYTVLTNYSVKLVNRDNGYDYYRNGTALVNSATILTATYIAANQYSAGTYQYIDNARIRKYASPEPTFSIGSKISI